MALQSNTPSVYRLIGWTCLLVPVVWNVWFLEAFVSSDGALEALTKSLVWISDVLLLVLGVSVITYGRQALVNLALVTASLVFCFGLFEFVLRTGVLDGASDPSPVWVPAKFKAINKAIDLSNYEFARRHPHLFSDKPRNKKKPEGRGRIAVLGDSFIWGDGLPLDQIWSHKLEKRITETFKNVEVLSWGKNGWSTLDEFRFLREHGIHYDIDLLIVGFVSNDPDLHTVPEVDLTWQGSDLLNLVRLVFPNVLDYVAAHLNRLIEQHLSEEYGYGNWKNKLYLTDNLREYGKLLEDFSAYCREKNLPLLFVLTPNNADPYFRARFDLIIPLLEKARIQYLDLYPVVYSRLRTYNPRLLWANLANGHPGPLVTEVYVDEVFKFLKTSGVLEQLAVTGKKV